MLTAVCLLLGGVIGAVADAKIGFVLIALGGLLMLVGR